MLLLLALKYNLQEKAFPSAKTKVNPNSARKLAKRKLASSYFYCLFDESYFSNIHTLKDILISFYNFKNKQQF